MLKKFTYLLILGIFSLSVMSCDKTNEPNKPKDPTEDSQNGGKDDNKEEGENQGSNEGENQGGNEGTGGNEGGNEGTGGNEGGEEGGNEGGDEGTGGNEGGDEGGDEGNGGDPGQLGYLDPDPSNLDFFQKVLCYKITGTWCQACPSATKVFREVKKSELKDKVEYANAYYNSGDLSNSDASLISQKFGNGYIPAAGYNLKSGVTNTITVSSMKSAINSELKSEARVGIGAKVELKDGKVIVKALVKSGLTKEYKLGVWLLEDEVYANQTAAPDDSYHTHHDVIRYIYKGSNSDIAGVQLSNLEPKAYANKEFEFAFKEGWKKENCKVLVFVSYLNVKKDNVITNMISCKIDEEVKMQYNK